VPEIGIPCEQAVSLRIRRNKVLTSFSFNGYSHKTSIQFFLSPTTHERR